MAYFFQCFLPDSAAYESYLRTGQLPPAIQHQQRQQHPERGRTALGHTQLARKHSTACLSSRPSSSLVSRPPTSSSASDEEKEGEEEAEYGVPPLTPIYSWDGDDDGGRSGGSAKRRKLEVTGLEALARAAEQSGDVLTWGTNGEEEEDGEEEKAKHQEEKGREEEEDAVMAEDGAGHSPEAMRVAVAAATALAAASSFPLPPPRAPSFTFDDRFPEAFALAFLAHPKDWPQILQALHTQGITATVPTDTRLLKRWYHEAFQASPHYLSYLMVRCAFTLTFSLGGLFGIVCCLLWGWFGDKR